ncbi:MAG TPA: long-chain fatty acid--CoA ligase [Thermodesulfobacteriota bacterium]|nr:long-chain fatty acid--CoA ligase [Thermodesulfobacteriota bacterium]
MNVGTLFTKSARTFPERLAIAYGDYELTYQQANQRINQLANALTSLGIKKGDNVAILLHNCPEFIETLFACFKAGIGTVPINFRLHPKECAFIIHNSEAVAVVLGDDFRDSLYALKSEMPRVKHYICITDPREGMVSYEGLLEGKSSAFADVDVERDDLAWLFYTSGTTGQPKGAMLTHHVLMTMTMNFFADMTPLGPEDVILHAAPLSHGSGVYSIPNVAKAAANIILASKSFDPKLVFEAIQRRKVTNMFMAPAMIKRLIISPEIDKYDLSSLKCIHYGGAPIYVEDLKAAVEKLGQIFVQLFGQAESPMTISYLRKEEHLLEGTEEQMKRLTSAGIPRTDLEVKIFDENDNELPSGKMGEIVVRGEVVMKGYWKNPTATAETLRGGWLHTGDLGIMDEKGYVYILDREKDMIISGGENIYSREIEDVILKHPAVHEVAVIGVPDETWGEAIKAIVAIKEGQKVTGEEIINFCKEYLASYKKPKSVEFINEVPKNPYGKVLKRELREKYWANEARRVR